MLLRLLMFVVFPAVLDALISMFIDITLKIIKNAY